tara:strand:+ start:5731 stop:5838 length:108 start_codon:yes stop_codon:yes gene_type:complete
MTNNSFHRGRFLVAESLIDQPVTNKSAKNELKKAY